MKYAISPDGVSYADYPYFDSEKEAYQNGKDIMWEAGELKLHIAKVVEVPLKFPFTPECVTEAIAQLVEEKYPGLGRDWFNLLNPELEASLKDYLNEAVDKWAGDKGIKITEDAYEEIGQYNLEVM